MPSSQKKEEKSINQEQQIAKKREPYQTPDIVYEGTISIRAGSPLGFEPKNGPFGDK